jgi:hypothetical protein
MGMSAEQARRHRQRRREGRIALLIEVDEVALLETLRISKWIGEFDGDPTRDELARILENVIATWVGVGADGAD